MNRLSEFKKGIIGGIPIALGYFAVSFSLGIQARQAGLNCFYASLMSLLNVTSAGEFAALAIIASGGSFVEMAISQLIINLRYMLMSCALTQKIDNNFPFLHRFFIAFGVTDEIFGISIARDNKLNPFFSYGAMFVAIPAWVLGTGLGVVFGNILPTIVVNALSVSLYGMFIAIVIPVAKIDKHVAIATAIAMLTSLGWNYIPVLNTISSGTKIIVLTIIISLIFAILFPIKDEENEVTHE